jgi:hypothetical protein
VQSYRFNPDSLQRQLVTPAAGTWIWRTTASGSPLDAAQLLPNAAVLEAERAHTVWYIAPAAARKPVLGSRIPLQNLHAMPSVDYVIFAPEAFKPAAENLASMHRQAGLKVAVVAVDQAYREFSGGVQDIMGLRNLLRMLWARAADSTKLRYLLLFGDASYDYKGRLTPNQNWVPAYQSPGSMAIKSSFVSDDFFGYLDPGEGGNLGAITLDLGIGRIPANSLAEAQGVVSKIARYADPALSIGSWRQRLNFVADDVDEDWEQILTLVSDKIAQRVDTQHADFEIRKLYADGYAQVSSAGNQSYPKLREELLRSVEEGNLITTLRRSRRRGQLGQRRHSAARGLPKLWQQRAAATIYYGNLRICPLRRPIADLCRRNSADQSQRGCHCAAHHYPRGLCRRSYAADRQRL